MTVNGFSMQSMGLIAIQNGLTSLTITGQDSGQVAAGSAKIIKVTGSANAGSSFNVSGDVGTVTLSGGMHLGSLFLGNQSAANFTVGGTLAGVVGFRRSVSTVNLASMNQGVLAIGGDLTTLTVTGTVNSSVITSGIWIGPDGVYNTADDVITGRRDQATAQNSTGGFIDSD